MTERHKKMADKFVSMLWAKAEKKWGFQVYMPLPEIRYWRLGRLCKICGRRPEYWLMLQNCLGDERRASHSLKWIAYVERKGMEVDNHGKILINGEPMSRDQLWDKVTDCFGIW